jgi:hypothetical protein
VSRKIISLTGQGVTSDSGPSRTPKEGVLTSQWLVCRSTCIQVFRSGALNICSVSGVRISVLVSVVLGDINRRGAHRMDTVPGAVFVCRVDIDYPAIPDPRGQDAYGDRSD